MARSSNSRFEPQLISVNQLDADGCCYSADGKQGVFGSLPGETVSAFQIARKRKRHYFRCEEVVENRSDDRIEARCVAASRCGGCSFQHLDHDAQLSFKLGQLKKLMSDTPPEEWLTPLADDPWHYRTKARMGVRYVPKKSRVMVGFREKMKPFIAETEQCPILQVPADDFPRLLSDLIGELSIYEAIPQVELAAGDDDMALVFRHLEPLTDADLSRLKQFGVTHSLQIFLQPAGLDSVWRLFPENDTNLDAPLTYSLPDYDLNFRFAPQDFTQVNLEVNRKMVNLALSLLAPNRSDHVFDAFCGIGNFSLALSRHAGQVTGVELAAASIDRARMNARENNVENVEFHVGDLHAENAEPPVFTEPQQTPRKPFNKVLLDPPRSGAEHLVKGLASTDVERVVYVSCNPETLARDTKILVSAGFELRSAGIIDMFPHTTHVESIALFVHPDRESNLTSAPLKTSHG